MLFTMHKTLKDFSVYWDYSQHACEESFFITWFMQYRNLWVYTLLYIVHSIYIFWRMALSVWFSRARSFCYLSFGIICLFPVQHINDKKYRYIWSIQVPGTGFFCSPYQHLHCSVFIDLYAYHFLYISLKCFLYAAFQKLWWGATTTCQYWKGIARNYSTLTGITQIEMFESCCINQLIFNTV